MAMSASKPRPETRADWACPSLARLCQQVEHCTAESVRWLYRFKKNLRMTLLHSVAKVYSLPSCPCSEVGAMGPRSVLQPHLVVAQNRTANGVAITPPCLDGKPFASPAHDAVPTVLATVLACWPVVL